MVCVTVIVTVRVEGLVTIEDADCGVPSGLPFATVTSVFVIELGINVFEGKVTVIVPDPPVKAFCTSKSMVYDAFEFTVVGLMALVILVTAAMVEIVYAFEVMFDVSTLVLACRV